MLPIIDEHRVEPRPEGDRGVQSATCALARLIEAPTSVVAARGAGNRTLERIGRVNTGDAAVSIAHMTSPAGWSEPWQRPGFDG